MSANTTMSPGGATGSATGPQPSKITQVEVGHSRSHTPTREVEDELNLIRLTSSDSAGRLHPGATLRSSSPISPATPPEHASSRPRPRSLLGAPLADYQSDDVLNAPGGGPAPSPAHTLVNPPAPSHITLASPPFPRTRASTVAPLATQTSFSSLGTSSPASATSSPLSPHNPVARPSMLVPIADREADVTPTPATPAQSDTGAARVPATGTGMGTEVRTPTIARSFGGFAAHTEGWTRERWGQRKVALVTGITGQDGSYLTELLLDKGYEVHGIIRRSSSFNTSRLHHLFSDERVERLALHYGDLTDSTSLVYIISQVQPSEVYNLGAQSHVKVSFEMAQYTTDVDGTGTLRLLDAIRTCGLDKLVKFYQASTSELYGQVRATPQDETTPFHPRSPYGVAKLYGFWITVNYRESYSMFTCNGILFNHESPRRGRTFVTRKISRAVAEISLGRQECMYLGNLDAMRDWGHARDYVEGMWRMMQHTEPDDFVLASGTSHSVREFVELAFQVVGRKVTWRGKGVDEYGVDDQGKVIVRVDPRYFRPAEVDRLQGDATKAKDKLGWQATVGFPELVTEMVLADVASAKYLVEDLN